MKNKYIVFIVSLIVIAVASAVIRLYHVTSPVADWHSWRQSDTAAVARNFEIFGMDLMHPRYDDLSNIQSGKDNPNGWRMVEYPLYQATGVILHRMLPMFTLETNLRLVSIISTAGSVCILALLLYELAGLVPALIGALVYAVLPFSIYYGRTILPDSFATFWALLGLFFLLHRSQKTHGLLWVIAGGLCAGVSVLVRPMAIFLLFPALYLLLRNFSYKKTIVSVFLFGILLCVPLFFWRKWILQYPEGIASSDWLFNKDGIRFKGAWFYWLFARRLAELILGYWGLIPFGVGLIARARKNEGVFSLLWLAGLLSYFVIFAGGNVQHDYYQALMIPVIVWFCALGLSLLVKRISDFNRVASVSLAIVSVVLMCAFSWFTLRTYFWINRPEIIEAGKAADLLLPKNAKVIAPYNGDTTFLYQIRRQGWPIGFDIDKKIEMGAQYYVSVSSTDDNWETNILSKTHPVLVQTKTYAIIDLTKTIQAK